MVWVSDGRATGLREVFRFAGARPRVCFVFVVVDRAGRFVARERDFEVFDVVATVDLTLVEDADIYRSFRAQR